ncbi:MAG: hypothetical protein Q9205_003322 [Flavoplaca limonia]
MSRSATLLQDLRGSSRSPIPGSPFEKDRRNLARNIFQAKEGKESSLQAINRYFGPEYYRPNPVPDTIIED